MFKKIITIVFLVGISFGNDTVNANVAYEKKEYTKAFKLYSEACEDGDSHSCGVVGAFYEDGKIVNKDYYKALNYYLRSCNMGNSRFCEIKTEIELIMPVCSEKEIEFSKDSRYFDVASADGYPLILADSKTISIDKKNKTIKVWIVYIASQKERDSIIKALNENYTNFGYAKHLYILNYTNRTSKIKQISYFDCSGDTIDYDNKDTKWSDITPGSIMEAILESLMQRYKLK